MNYPKAVMKISELQKMGFTKNQLLEAYRTRGQTFARKKSAASNAVIVFDTEEFER